MFNAMMQFSRKDAIDREWGKRLRKVMLDSLHNNQLSHQDKDLSALIDMFEEVTDFPFPDGTVLHEIPMIQGTAIGYIESTKPAYHNPPDD